MNATTKTRSALRQSLKAEDASIEKRLPATRAAAGKAGPAKVSGAPAAAKAPAVPRKSAPAKAPATAGRPAEAKKPAAPKKPAATTRVAAAGPAVPARAAAPKAAARKSAAPEAKKSRAASPGESKPTPAQAPSAAAPHAQAPSALIGALAKDAFDAKKKPAKTTEPVAGKAEAKSKEKRDKVVRDSFSMPKSEHGMLKDLRGALAKKGRICTKSELLRAGVQLVAAMKPADIIRTIDALTPVAKGKGKK